MKRLWKLHSWLGLIAGLGLLVIGLTGSALVFRAELEAIFSRDLTRVSPTPAGRLPLDTLLAEAQRALPEYEVGGWMIGKEPGWSDRIYATPFGGHEAKTATMDPSTGRLLTQPLGDRETLTGWLLDLHYALLAGHTGMFFAGLLAATLCFLGVSGLWLYRGFWRSFFTLRWGRSARIFFSDTHKMIGISSVAFNLVLGFTGAYWNLTHVIGDLIEGHKEEIVTTRRFYAGSLSLDAMIGEAAQKLPGFRTGFVALPSAEDPDITLWGHAESQGILRSEYSSSVIFDGQTGAFKSVSNIREAGLWAQVVDAFAPLHYGTFGGLPVKILWSLGGLAPGALAVSGFLIWWTRRPGMTRRAPKGALQKPQFSDKESQCVDSGG
jgi:uncharacterized iron-regulated membrane protein